MTYARHLTLLAAPLSLLVAACSQPQDLAPPSLDPQYGTPREDSATHVATNEEGHLYTLGTDIVDTQELWHEEPVLKRFGTGGKELWSRGLGLQCGTGVGLGLCHTHSYELSTDAMGNSYALYGRNYAADNPHRETTYTDATLKKYSPSGTLLWTQPIFSRVVAGSVAMATTPAGETLVAFWRGMWVGHETFTATSHLVKYGSDGTLIFDKPHVVEVPQDATLGRDGSLYLVGNDRVVKYSGDGTLLWQRTLPIVSHRASERIAAGGGNVYVLLHGDFDQDYRILLYKYSSSGKLLWQRSIKPFGNAYIYSLGADASGNVHLAGTTNPNARYPGGEPSPGEFSGYDLVVRKYTPKGSIAWTYTPKLLKTYEAARGVSAAASGKVYVVGETTGKVNGQNYGGMDAFLLRLNTAGKKVWSR